MQTSLKGWPGALALKLKTAPVAGEFPRSVSGWSLWILLAVIASGCAGPQLQPTPEPFLKPAIHGDYVLLSDGYRLPLSRWHPDGEPSAVVIALHGFNDYRRAFKPLGQYLAARGVATYAYDQRGFGGSPYRGIWPGTPRLIQDVREVLSALARRYPATPVYLAGDSMGGAAAMVAAESAPREHIDGLILLAPAVWGRETMNPFMRMALWLGVRTAPQRQWTGEGLDLRPTDNLEALRRMGRDPLVIKGTRTDALWGVTNLMERALSVAGTLSQPRLIAYGEHDEIIPRRPTCRMLEAMTGEAPLTVAVYPDGYHMLLQDHQSRHVLKDIAAWISRPGAGLEPAPYRRPDEAWRTVLCGQ